MLRYCPDALVHLGAAQNLKGEAFQFPKEKKKFIPREGGPSKKAKKAAADGAEAAAPAAKAEEKPAE